MALDQSCATHDWTWDVQDGYGCPVCEGTRQERERILTILDTALSNCHRDLPCSYCDATNDHLLAIAKETDNVATN